MKLKLYLTICLLSIIFGSQAQRQCSTHEHHEKMMAENEAYRNARLQIEQFNNTIRSFKTDDVNNKIITIPVVVHVLYNKFEDSLTNEQILSQIEVLNRDFQLLNDEVNSIPDEFAKVASPTAIRFELARRKPDGSATNGIVRKFTTKVSFSDNNDMKFSERGGDNAWDASQYLNLWVCRLTNNLLGYAQLPGGAAASDGVVINPIAFGTMGTAKYPYNKGRTATHEIGHWLNLTHIWGDKTNCQGDDFVDDTPPQNGPTYGTPKTQPVSCGFNTMYMNFMDYTDDAAMAMFTAGQAARMEKLFEEGGFRFSILSSKGLQKPDGAAVGEEPLGNTNCNTTNNQLRSTAKTVRNAAVSYGQINRSGKNDWYEFSNNKVQNNIYITLTDLAADLDIALYDDNGLLLARSRRSGTKPEAIKWNDAAVGKYYVRVYGYKGATSNNCYALQTQISKTAFKTDETDGDNTETPKPEDLQNLESKLYPNPATAAVNFEVMLDEANELSIELFDLLGHKVKTYQFYTQVGLNGLNIDLNDLQSGVYNLVAKSGESTYKQKLILSK
jgi:hypothetical protein